MTALYVIAICVHVRYLTRFTIALFSVQRSIYDDPIYIHDTPDVLSSETLRAFWVSWEPYSIALGTGTTLGQDMLFSYEIGAELWHAVHSITMTTSNGHAGEWEVITNQDQVGACVAHMISLSMFIVVA